MEVKAKLSFLKMSPRKVRRVIDVVRGLTTSQAISQLQLMNKAAALPIIKLINSAIANAVHNFNLEKDNLLIKSILANDGPTLKRWTPKAHGRATPIRKRMSHVELILAEITPSKKTAKKVKADKDTLEVKEKKGDLPVEKAVVRDERIDETNVAEKGHEIKDVRMEGKHRHQQHADKRNMKGKKGFMNKIFNRKVG